MCAKETIQEQNDSVTGNCNWQKIRLIGLEIYRAIYTAMTGDVCKSQAIHPNFRMAWKINDRLTWYQNRDWGPVPDPPFKIGFYFDNPRVLDSCKWIGKIGNNLNRKLPQHRYFFVGYGDPSKFREGYDLQAMMKWAEQFDHPSLMHYDGRLIKMLREEQTE